MDDEVEDDAEEFEDEEFADDTETIAEVPEDAIEIDLEEPIDTFEDEVAVVAEVEVEDEADDEEEEAAPRARKVSEDEDEDEDEDPDDVEADLEAILRDRMAAAEDDDEDEAEETAAGDTKVEGTAPARNDEFVCESCFMLVNRSQFGSAKDPRCPMGDPECPPIIQLFGS